MLSDIIYKLSNTNPNSSNDSGFFSGNGGEPRSNEDKVLDLTDRTSKELDETIV